MMNVSMKSKEKNKKLMKHMSRLLKLREKGKHEKASSLDHFPWPKVRGLERLKEIVSTGVNRPIALKRQALKAISRILKEIGRVNVAIAAPLVVARTLEIFTIEKSQKRWHLIKGMHDLAIGLKRWRESAEGMQEATLLISEGALLCSTEVASFTETGPPGAEENAGGILPGFVSVGDLEHFMQRLRAMSIQINDNGQVEEDLPLTVQQEVDINTGQVEEDPLVPQPQKAYIHNDEQVEEDLPVPELQKSHIHNNEQVEEDLLSSGCLKVFKMEALVDATKNFHEDNKVGQGGFGAVYKGTTHDGTQIAVKKMSFTDEGRRELMKKQFENEKLLAEFQHRNLVKLLGSCEQESQGFLVYEYLPKGSLDRLLFDPDKRKELDWNKRYNIILGVARGLVYLHQDSRLRTVHRDIKASNILLDEELKPKIGDFGAAKLFPENRTHITTEVAGTFGYMAPEYFLEGKFTVKTDVYSFGIFLLELLTGEQISSNAVEGLGQVWRLYKKNQALQTIDPTMIRTRYKEKAKALTCIQVGLLCTQENSSLRPTMSQVTTMLTNFGSLPVPRKPPFQPSTARSWKMATLPRKLYAFMRAVFICRNRE